MSRVEMEPLRALRTMHSSPGAHAANHRAVVQAVELHRLERGPRRKPQTVATSCGGSAWESNYGERVEKHVGRRRLARLSRSCGSRSARLRVRSRFLGGRSRSSSQLACEPRTLERRLKYR